MQRNKLKKLPFGLTKLPTDVLISICLHLRAKDISALMFASKITNNLFSNESRFWKLKYQQLLPNSIPVNKFGAQATHTTVVKQRLFFSSLELKHVLKMKPQLTSELKLQQQPVSKSSSPSLLKKFFKKVNRNKENNVNNNNQIQNDEIYLLELDDITASQSVIAKPFKLSKICDLIEDDNFVEFIAETTYFTDAMTKLDMNVIVKLPSLALSDLLEREEKHISSVTKKTINLNDYDFSFVFSLLPLAIEKNLVRFFDGLTNFFMLFVIASGLDFHQSIWIELQINALIDVIFNSNKSYFIEKFINQIHALPKLSEYKFYKYILEKTIAGYVDFAFILQNEALQNNLLQFLTDNIHYLNNQDDNKKWTLYLRLLSRLPLHEQLERFNQIFESGGKFHLLLNSYWKNGSYKNYLYTLLKNLLNQPEFAQQKNSYEVILEIKRIKEELDIAEIALSKANKNLEESSANMSVQALNDAQDDAADLNDTVIKLQAAYEQAQVNFQDALLSSQQTESHCFRIKAFNN